MDTLNTGTIKVNAVEFFAQIEKLEGEVKKLKAQIADLATITTPMKAECMGEFKETYEVYCDDEEDYIEESRVISWPNMKDIYAMMLAEKLKEGV